MRGLGHPGPSPWTDLDRPPLDAGALRRDLLVPGGLWTSLDVVTETGSTNTDLAARARDGARAGPGRGGGDPQGGPRRRGRRPGAP
ncbi:biotin--[acetyl-CoA-carboxylase] ligase, partial [Kitasatospora sp. NPDC059571]